MNVVFKATSGPLGFQQVAAAGALNDAASCEGPEEQ